MDRTEHHIPSGPVGVLSLFALLVLVLVVVCVVGAGSAFAAGGACPNEEIRKEQGSTFLPDCRAYELVTPPGGKPAVETTGKPAQGLLGSALGARAAVGGGALAWFSYYPLPGEAGDTAGGFDVSRRGEDGWSTVDVVPPRSSGETQYFDCLPYVVFSASLSEEVLSDGFQPTVHTEGSNSKGLNTRCAEPEPPVVVGEPVGVNNIFLRSSSSGSGYRLLDLPPVGVTPSEATFEAASSGFGRVFFEEEAALVEGAPAGEDLYDWSEDGVRLVTFSPAGVPVFGTLANGVVTTFNHETDAAATDFTHAVSEDGSRAFFAAGGDLFARVNPQAPQSAVFASGPDAGKVNGEQCEEAGKACTVQVDASQAGGSGGGGTFLWASADGERVFFTDKAEAGLTANTVAGSGVSLYEYEVGTHTLRDLTPVAASAKAGVLGVSGAGESGEDVYFVAEGALAAGAALGKPNLYVVEGEGPPVFIATLSSRDSHDWGGNEYELDLLRSRVSPDGGYIGFDSVEELTGYPNAPAETGECETGAGCDEIFLYGAKTGSLVCVSCGTAGTAPLGPTAIHYPERVEESVTAPAYLQRSVLDGGRVFFNSPDRLAGASDGQQNVYEYEEGRLSLLSTGTSTGGSYFFEASESGEDVFLATEQGLVSSDTDNGMSVYDARVNGGYPADVEAPAQPPACTSVGGCAKPPVEPPAAPFAASSTATGQGNIVSLLPSSYGPEPKAKPKAKSCRKGSVRRRGRCVKKHTKKSGKGKHAKKAKRAAKGGGRDV